MTLELVPVPATGLLESPLRQELLDCCRLARAGALSGFVLTSASACIRRTARAAAACWRRQPRSLALPGGSGDLLSKCEPAVNVRLRRAPGPLRPAASYQFEAAQSFSTSRGATRQCPRDRG